MALLEWQEGAPHPSGISRSGGRHSAVGHGIGHQVGKWPIKPLPFDRGGLLWIAVSVISPPGIAEK
jgi:hypothetical protein